MQDPYIKFDKALRLRREGNLSEAKCLLQELVEELPKSVMVLVYLGHTMSESGMMEDAINMFRQATELGPKNENASLGLFFSLWNSDRHDEALEEMGRFLKEGEIKEYRQLIADMHEEMCGGEEE